ncbi:sulfonate transport system permease protein [Sanguibacter gelidistatuariae]|uniref:Sulfonate transport system permease protein n=1 Tax=Sanguibacter gelidistatuariae TaxID=1814289 RepID=A0A1G6H261_9MICO|nr:ABC transporter permease [Sanguibacter gelidistatuariae]SDB88218.1 sulfonate transport system permease protein [Sanguibacter gelidistatuariae]
MTAQTALPATNQTTNQTTDQAGLRGAVAGPASGTEGLVPPAVRRVPNQATWVATVLRASVPLVLFAAWWYGSASGAIDPLVFPSPQSVWTAFRTLSENGVLWDNASVSLTRVAVGFAIGGTLGLSLGILAGLFRLGDQLLDPTLQMLRTIPFLAIAPLLILWFGIDELPKIIIIAAAALFPLYLNAHSGVRNVDKKILEAAGTFGLRGLGLIRHVILPEAIPSILVGLRVSLSVSLLALIVAEQSNAPRGLGFLMTSAQQYFQTDVLVLCIMIYAIWGLGVDLLVRLLERALLPYKYSRKRS